MAYRVLTVPGRMVLHPGSIGAPQKHMIGHERFTDESESPAIAPHNYRRDPLSGEIYPLTQYRRKCDAVVMPEYEGYYIYRAIMDGDLDYIESVAKDGSTSIDDSLERATSRNRKSRGEVLTAREAYEDAERTPKAPKVTVPVLASQTTAEASLADAPKIDSSKG